MIERPDRHIREFARAGADDITAHVEATPRICTTPWPRSATPAAPQEPRSTLGTLPTASPRSPETLDLALCMSVNPGWGAQELIPASLPKLTRMRAALPDYVALEVDGGVHAATAGSCAQAGANLLVTGSAIFGAKDPAAAYAEIALAAGFD